MPAWENAGLANRSTRMMCAQIIVDYGSSTELQLLIQYLLVGDISDFDGPPYTDDGLYTHSRA